MGRRLLAVAAIAAFSTISWGLTTAGAQVFTCTFTMSATTLGPGGGPVQVSGTAPADTPVKVLVNGVVVAETQSSKVDGSWGPLTVTITATSDVSVSISEFYPATPCVGPGGTSVERVTVAGAALPRTGSNGVEPMVLAGITVLVVGLVLTVAARRRETARGRI